ncbi:Predicted arabinose efflux permease, MFS family [Pseudomonas asplenii]|uniref:Predicted arabinose efflux permease, MFS family n=1 Tax=Pseudomonas asplenii TaxID=53407 RepID=A0A1H1SW98_9PSED|nr:MFS transporter [Pseudomonas asplenii]SDS52128.1 Predicted arabinose efflux permease, MFS family [Pseudomonas asplenii]
MPSTATNPRSSNRPRLLLVTGISLISFFPLNVLLPAFPTLAEQFATSTADIALTVSLFTLVFAFSQLLTGPLSDRLGRKEVLLACLTIACMGAIGCTLTLNFTTFLFFRGVQALGCGFFVLGLALVEDLFEPQDRACVRISYMSFSGLFVALSPLLGSWLLDHFGWKSSFHAFAIVAAGLFLLALRVLPPRCAADATHSPAQRLSIGEILSHGDFRRYWQIAALVFCAYFALTSVSPLIFMDGLRLSEYQYAIVLLIYGTAYLFGGVAAAWLQKRLGVRAQIDIGLLLLGAAGLALLLILQLGLVSTASLLLPMCLSAAAVSITRPAAISAAMLLFSANAGTAASAGNTLMFLAAAAGSAVLARSDTLLLPTLGMGFIICSLLGLLNSARIGR